MGYPEVRDNETTGQRDGGTWGCGDAETARRGSKLAVAERTGLRTATWFTVPRKSQPKAGQGAGCGPGGPPHHCEAVPADPDQSTFCFCISSTSEEQDFACGSCSITSSTVGVFSIARRRRNQDGREMRRA